MSPVVLRARIRVASRGTLLSLLLAAPFADPPPAAAGVDRWTPADPPGGGVVSLVLDPFEPRTGYAVSYAAPGPAAEVQTRLWRTTDAGASWSRWLPRLPAAGAATQVAHDPHWPGRIYLVTQDGLFLRERAGGGWRLRWPGEIERLAFDAAAPGLLYAATDTSLSRSEDGGRTWTVTRQYSLGTRLSELFSDPAAPGRVYASMRFPVIGGEGSAWLERSDDGGRTWEEVSSWSYSAPDFLLAPTGAPDGPSVLYAATDRSTDGGETWEPTSFPGATVLAVPGAPSTLYVQGPEAPFRSRDGGATWQPVEGIGALRSEAGEPLVAHPAAPERIFRLGAGSNRGLETAQVVGSQPLVLQGGRFEARAAWRDGEGRFGAALAVPESEAAGVFALPGRRKVLAALDVLDERAAGGRFRVVGAGVLPMEATVTVTDRATGVSRDLFFPPDRALSLTDSGSFPALPEPPGVQASSVGRAQGEAKLAASGPCVPSATSLCLLGGRYRVEIYRQDGVGGPRFAPLARQAPIEPLLWESGTAWFRDPDVPSAVVQLVDEAAQNGSVWVLVGGLSEEGYVVRVRDTLTGATRRYVHLPGPPASVADLDAFRAPPRP
jgi:hypothetical protein